MNEKVTGLALVGTVCASQVLSALTSRVAVQSLDAPFFLMWIHTLMMAWMWPLGLVVETASVMGCHTTNTTAGQNPSRFEQGGGDTPNPTPTTRRHLALLVKDARQKVPRMLSLIVLLFYPLWIAANYCYVAALRHVPASTMVSIFGSCTAFVSIQEGIWLQQPVTSVRVMAVLLAMGGVVAYGILAGVEQENEADRSKHHILANDDNSLLMGIFLGTCSSLAAATYKVAFKKFLASPVRIDVCLFLTVLGLVNGVVGLLPTLALARWGIEEPFYDAGLSAVSWGIIWCGSFFILVFNASIAFGIAVTSPLFIAVGTVLTIPITDAIDYFWMEDHQAFVGNGQIAASAAILASFILIVVFDQHSVVVGVPPASSSTGGVAGSSIVATEMNGNGTANEVVSLRMISVAGDDEAGSLLVGDSMSELNSGSGMNEEEEVSY